MPLFATKPADRLRNNNHGTTVPTTTLHRILASSPSTLSLTRRPSLPTIRSKSTPTLRNPKLNESVESFLAAKGTHQIDSEGNMTALAPTEPKKSPRSPMAKRFSVVPLPSPTKVKNLAKRQIKQDYSEMRAQKELRRASRSKRRTLRKTVPVLDTIGEDGIVLVHGDSSDSFDSMLTVEEEGEVLTPPPVDDSEPALPISFLDTTSPVDDLQSALPATTFLDTTSPIITSPPLQLPLDDTTSEKDLHLTAHKNSRFRWAPQRPTFGSVPDPLHSHPVDPEEVAKALYCAPAFPLHGHDESATIVNLNDVSPPTTSTHSIDSLSSTRAEPSRSRRTSALFSGDEVTLPSIAASPTPRPSVAEQGGVAPEAAQGVDITAAVGLLTASGKSPNVPDLAIETPTPDLASPTSPTTPTAAPSFRSTTSTTLPNIILETHNACMLARKPSLSSSSPTSPTFTPKRRDTPFMIRKARPSNIAEPLAEEEPSRRGSVTSLNYEGEEDDEVEMGVQNMGLVARPVRVRVDGRGEEIGVAM